MLKYFILILILCPLSTQNFPKAFNATDLLSNSPVHSQSWGTCWAHATTLAFELDLIKNGHGYQIISPYYIDKFNGFNKDGIKGEELKGEEAGQGEKFIGSNSDDNKSGVTVHQGGDFKMALAAIASLGGIPKSLPHLQLNDTHSDFEKFGDDQFSGIKKSDPSYQFYFPRHVEFLGNLKGKKDFAKMILLSGYTLMSAQKYQDEPTDKTSKGEIHLYTGEEKPNHAVNIIGWDDEIDQGSWLVQDSFHKDSGIKLPHIFIPYRDKHILSYPEMDAVLIRDIFPRTFNNVYTYSLHGPRYTSDEGDIELIKINFNLSKDEIIKGIAIVTPYSEAKYKIILYNSSGEVLQKREGQTGAVGLHFVDFNYKILKSSQYQVGFKLDRPIYYYDASFTMDLLLAEQEGNNRINVNSRAKPGEALYLSKGTLHDFSTYRSITNDQSKNSDAMKNDTASPTFYLYTKRD